MKDVIHEDAITVAGKPRAPDYSFRIGGARKFFPCVLSCWARRFTRVRLSSRPLASMRVLL